MSEHATSRIAVYGSGYVGLVVAACLAEAGLDVLCIEIDEERLSSLQRLQLDAIEMDSDLLRSLVRSGVDSGRLSFAAGDSSSPAASAFICVGTPSMPSGEADLTAVHAVADTVVSQAVQDTVILVKSTVPPGTCAGLEAQLQSKMAGNPETGKPFRLDVIANPEFLRQGRAVEDFCNPDRVMIGADSERAKRIAEGIYSVLLNGPDRLIFADSRSAELAKYGCNAFLAARIAMINDFALLADRYGADVATVRRCIGSDPRIGSDFLAPGCGFGGSCLGKDLKALEHLAGNHLESGLFSSILRGNEQHKLHLLRVAENCFPDSLKGLRAAVWGLAFKAGTTDTRSAPASDIIGGLIEAGADICAWDPQVAVAPHGVATAPDALSAAQDADLLLICTDWPEFAATDWQALKKRMRRPLIIDGRNLLDPDRMRKEGFEYFGMGRRL